MNNRLRILIVSDSPCLPTGLAETTRIIFSTLLDLYPDCYELHQVALFHCYAVTSLRWPVYPTEALTTSSNEFEFAADDKYGQRTAVRVIKELQPDIVFAFGDPHRVIHL